jgi:hypothetical protein
MLVYLVAIVVAVAIVPITGGRFRRLVEVEIARPALLFVGLGIQIALDVVDLPRARYDDVGFALLLLSYACILGFCLSNLRLTGMGVVTVGIAMNASVIALNQGMPYTVPEGERAEVTVKQRPERPDDVLPVLSDRIPLGSPFAASISFGDLVIAVGIVDIAYRASRRPRRSRATLPHPSRGVDIDLAEYEEYERLVAARRARAEIPEYDPFESVEHAGVVDVTRT